MKQLIFTASFLFILIFFQNWDIPDKTEVKQGHSILLENVPIDPREMAVRSNTDSRDKVCSSPQDAGKFNPDIQVACLVDPIESAKNYEKGKGEVFKWVNYYGGGNSSFVVRTDNENNKYYGLCPRANDCVTKQGTCVNNHEVHSKRYYCHSGEWKKCDQHKKGKKVYDHLCTREGQDSYEWVRESEWFKRWTMSIGRINGHIPHSPHSIDNSTLRGQIAIINLTSKHLTPIAPRPTVKNPILFQRKSTAIWASEEGALFAIGTGFQKSKNVYNPADCRPLFKKAIDNYNNYRSAYATKYDATREQLLEFLERPSVGNITFMSKFKACRIETTPDEELGPICKVIKNIYMAIDHIEKTEHPFREARLFENATSLEKVRDLFRILDTLVYFSNRNKDLLKDPRMNSGGREWQSKFKRIIDPAFTNFNASSDGSVKSLNLYKDFMVCRDFETVETEETYFPFKNHDYVSSFPSRQFQSMMGGGFLALTAGNLGWIGLLDPSIERPAVGAVPAILQAEKDDSKYRKDICYHPLAADQSECEEFEIIQTAGKAYSASYPLMYHGRVVRNPLAALQDGVTHPRTVIGLTRDRKALVAFVVEGRLDGLKGADFETLIQILKACNVHTALNFDGGASSQFIFRGLNSLNPLAKKSLRQTFRPLDRFCRNISREPGSFRLSFETLENLDQPLMTREMDKAEIDDTEQVGATSSKEVYQYRKNTMHLGFKVND